MFAKISLAVVLFFIISPTTFSQQETMSATSSLFARWNTFAPHNTHSLHNAIWSRHCSCFITPETLLTEIGKKNFVLLGEIHPNPEHHHLQSSILADLIEKYKKENKNIALGLEMLDVLNIHQTKSNDARQSATEFAEAVKWKTQWSYDFALYKPIIEIALARHITIFGTDTNDLIMKTIALRGLETIPESDRALLLLTEPFPDKYRKHLESLFKQFHAKTNLYMLDAQRLRDARMAYELVKIRDGHYGMDGVDGIVLIAGGGHTADYGVPFYLNKHVGISNVATIEMIETRSYNPQITRAQYAELFKKYIDIVFHDYLIFTPSGHQSQ